MKSSIMAFLVFFLLGCSTKQSAKEETLNVPQPTESSNDDIAIASRTEVEIDTMGMVSTTENAPAEETNPIQTDTDPQNLTFDNFISLFLQREDVSAFQNEDYYFSFAQQNYGAAVGLQKIAQNEEYRVFRAKYGESEVEADNIWVYDINGTQISMCHLPSSGIATEVNKLIIDTLSLDNPLKFAIDVAYTRYKVVDDLGAPERGEAEKEVAEKYEIIIDQNGKCTEKK